MKGNQRIALTKRLLHEALLRIMHKKPLDRINVTELCEEAQINRATFYRHYNVPRDVLAEMQAMFTDRVRVVANMDELCKAPAQCVERLCTYLHENAELVKVFIENNSYEDITHMFDESFKVILMENRSIHSHPLDSTEIDLVTAFMAGGGYFMLRRWLLDDIDKSPQEIAKLVLSFVDTELK